MKFIKPPLNLQQQVNHIKTSFYNLFFNHNIKGLENAKYEY